MATKTPKKRTRSPARKKRAPRRKPFNQKHIIGFLFGISLLLSLFLFGLFYSLAGLKIPDLRSVAYYQPLQTTTIYDRYGVVVDRISSENRTVVPLSAMSPLLPKAFVAAEDSRFHDHPGLDLFSVLRAAVINVKRGGRAQGGSTITQQVARSLLLTPEKSYIRKFREAILAWRIDQLLTKDEILYIYLNQIYLGEGAYGVQEAARVYFNKSTDKLNLAECAMLAGLPQAPSRYSPLKNYKAAKKRQYYVLNRMNAEKMITKKQANHAFQKRLAFHKPPLNKNSENGYFLRIVKKRAEKILNVPLARAGVRIYTTLDSTMQRRAVGSLRKGVKQSFNRQPKTGKKRIVPQGALVSIDICSGKVRALVGGVDWAITPYDRATSARRPAGSVFKPLLYSAALEKGMSPKSTVLDGPLALKRSGSEIWRPKNFSGRFHGQVTLSEALVHSYNSAAIRLLQKTGVDSVHRIASASGVSSKMTTDLSLALGAVDVSLLEMTAAYTPFGCSGYYRPPVFIEKITEMSGETIYQPGLKKKPVLTPKTAKAMKNMLGSVVSMGTGRRASGLPVWSGGKTGTSNDNRDAWFIGFTNKMLTGVWVGHDDNRSLGRGENGGRTAAPIWLEFMKQANGVR